MDGIPAPQQDKRRSDDGQAGQLVGRESEMDRIRAFLAAARIEAAPLAALDLPWRVVVWKNGYQTLVSYAAPAAVARRYGLADDLAAALASIDALTSAVIDR